MILMRLSGLPGKYCEIEGENQFHYGQDKAGWFPVENVSFNVQAKSESKATSTSGSKSVKGATTHGSSNGADNKKSGGEAKNDEAFSNISVTKFVDAASIWLMQYALEDRSKTKADQDKMRKADFHLIHSVKGVDLSGRDRFIFPYMQITLGNVLIKSWSLSASGDERPTETIDIWFEKSAMRYYRTKEGQVWTGGQVAGWDQSKPEKWDGGDAVKDYFAEADLGKAMT